MLSGWKEIAAFLEKMGGPKSERMARYLVDDGLPAYQIRSGGRVHAREDDLRIWWLSRMRLVQAKPVADSRRPLPRRSKAA